MQKGTFFFIAFIFVTNLSSNAYAQSSSPSSVGGFFHRVSSWFQRQSSHSNTNPSADPEVATPVAQVPAAPAPIIVSMPTATPVPTAPPVDVCSQTTIAESRSFKWGVDVMNHSYLKVDATVPGEYQVQYSRLELTGKKPSINSSWASPTDLDWVSAEILNPDCTTEHLTWKTDEDGLYDQRLTLKKGPGTYKIKLISMTPAEEKGFWTRPVTLAELTIYNSDTLDETPFLPSEAVQSDDPEVITLAQDIVKNAQTEMDAARAIHDWVSTHVTYDYDEAARISATPPEATYIVSVPGYVTGTALYTVHRGEGVCQDYSVVYATLARSVGLPTRVIGGEALGATSENHAWNEVLVGGNWVTLDTTWDAGNVAAQTYFDPDPTFFSKTHTKTVVESI